MGIELPDLTTYRPHRVIEDIDLCGVPVPGLRGAFYRRRRDDRLESGGHRYPPPRGFLAWGYVGEPHCRWHAVRRIDGSWQRPRTGCPEVRLLRSGADVTGLAVYGTERDLLVEPGSGYGEDGEHGRSGRYGWASQGRDSFP